MSFKRAFYLPAFDGLRAIAVMIVFFAHILWYGKFTTQNIVPGSYGVTVFFFISGFLITRLLQAELKKQGGVNLKTFYIRRFIRLYPPLLCFLLLGVAFEWFTQHIIYKDELLSGLLYFENYYLVYDKDPTNRYAILWSLGVEEHFYLFYPFLFLLFPRHPRRLLIAVITLTIIPLIFRCLVAIHYGSTSFSHNLNYTISHCRFDSILFGCISQLILNSGYSRRYINISSNKVLYVIALLAVPFSLVYPDSFFKQTFRYTVQGLSLMILIPPILYNTQYSFFNRILSARAMVNIGKWSYSIYLFHYLVVIILDQYTYDSKLVYAIVNIILSLLFSLAGYYFIELPFFALRKRFGSKVQPDTVVQSRQKEAAHLLTPEKQSANAMFD